MQRLSFIAHRYLSLLVFPVLFIPVVGATLFLEMHAGALVEGSGTLNEAPEPPFNLTLERFDSDVVLSWGFGLDAETFFAELTYDLRVGSTPGGSDIIAPDGKGGGNQRTARTIKLGGLKPGTYYWSVQSVDEEQARSEFAAEQVFEIGDDEFRYVEVISSDGGRGTWADYDNDGDLDIVFIGSEITDSKLFSVQIYKNEGGKFTTISTSLPAVNNGKVQLADYDNDNDLDILLLGSTGEPSSENDRVAQLYQNIEGRFVDTGISAGTAFLCTVTALDRILADVDNNGFVDLLNPYAPGGFNGSIGVRKNYGGKFEESYVPWAEANSAGTLVAGDFNNDGAVDVFASGLDNSACKAPANSLYKNSGKSFEFVSTSMVSGFDGRPAWGDYDADGDLDIITAGSLFGGLDPGFGADFSGIYRNDGGAFNLAAELLPDSQGEPAWGDYDMDGDLDVILPSGSNAALYENRKGTFVLIAGAFDGMRVSHARWGDYDGDQDLDALVSGYLDGVFLTRLYSNVRAAKNDVASAPTGLSTSVNDNSVTFSWKAGSDEETPSPGLTYNVRVGTSPGGSEAMSAAALKDGTILQPVMGNVFHNTSWTLKDLPEGTYYWSVQAVDGGFSGSAFAEENSFTIGTEEVADFTDSAMNLMDLEEGDAEWGDYDDDGDLDLLITGASASGAATRLYKNEGNTLSDTGMSFEDLDLSDASWSDVDLDGDLDFVITGRGTGETHVSVLYLNKGASFEAQFNAFPGVIEGAVDWGDYDNDGDPDLLLTGLTSSLENITRVYENDGGAFSDIGAGLTGVRRGDVSWVDYDVDGDQDILITGRIDNAINRRTILYRNDAGAFTEIDDGLPNVDLSGIDWGDYDNDGDPDLVLTGTTGSQFVATIYRNDSGSLTNINANLPGAEFSDVQWGDYDNDGDLDLLFSGSTTAGRLAAVYRNDAGSFVSIDAQMTGVSKSSVAWGDYDNDGDLDAFVMGQASDSNRESTLYINNTDTPNTPPGAPAELWAAIDIEAVTLNWTNGSDKETSTEGLSYNLRMGTVPGGDDIISPHASSSGKRHIVRRGNAGQGNAWAVKFLKAGTYYWSIQSIDGAYAGSSFNSEHSFTLLDDLLPVELTTFTGVYAGSSVLLEWETASETNNAGFSIERSTDGASFYRIDFVEGKGTISGKSTYRYTDEALPFAVSEVFYRLKQIDFDGQFAYSSVVQVPLELPAQAALWPNYPNPFNPTTEIRYELPVSSQVLLSVYDATGKQVAVLVDGFQEAGRYDARFDGALLASGVYFYRLETASVNIMKQMILLK